MSITVFILILEIIQLICIFILGEPIKKIQDTLDKIIDGLKRGGIDLEDDEEDFF